MNPTQHWLFVVDDWLLEFGFDVVVVCLLVYFTTVVSLLECGV